jgi:RND family efflux transporter MFP subunit
MKSLPTLAWLGLFLVGCQAPSGPKSSATPKAAAYVLGVEAALPALEKVAQTLKLSGTVVADRSVDLAAPVSGRVTEVNAVIGERVVAGQLLVRLSPVEVERKMEKDVATAQQQASQSGLLAPDGKIRPAQQVPNIRKSLSGLDYAKQKYQNYVKMRQEELVSDQQVTDAYHDYMNAKNDYEAALENYRTGIAYLSSNQVDVTIDRERLADYLVQAPYDAYVQECKVSLGAYSNQGQPLGLKLVSAHPLYVQLDVPQQHAAELGRGQSVKVTCDAQPNRELRAVVERVSPIANQQTRTLSMQARLQGAPEWLKPGMYVSASLAVKRPQERLLIPESAVLTQQGKSVVFTLQAEDQLWRVHQQTVQIGPSHQDWVEVKGILPKQWVIASDLASLQDGIQVKIARETRFRP